MFKLSLVCFNDTLKEEISTDTFSIDIYNLPSMVGLKILVLGYGKDKIG